MAIRRSATWRAHTRKTKFGRTNVRKHQKLVARIKRYPPNKQVPKLVPRRSYDFFVGWNNKTHDLEIGKMRVILDKYLTGYTIDTENTGIWEKKPEKSAQIIVVSTPDSPCDDKTAKSLKRELTKNLHQQVVLTARDDISEVM